MKFTFEKIPNNVQEFKSMSNFSLKTPHSTAALFALALCKFPEDKQASYDMINVLKGPVPLTRYDEMFLRDRFMDKIYLPFSYFEGATVQNNYTPNMPLSIEVFDDTMPPRDENLTRLFLSSAGADSKRPITLRKKADDYFLYEYSSILLSIRIPSKDDPWA